MDAAESLSTITAIEKLGIPLAVGFLAVWFGRLLYGGFNHDLQVLLSSSRVQSTSASADHARLKIVLKKGKVGRLRLDKIVVRGTRIASGIAGAGVVLPSFWEDASEPEAKTTSGIHLVPGDVVQFSGTLKADRDDVVHWHVYIRASRRILIWSFGKPTWTASEATLPLSSGTAVPAA